MCAASRRRCGARLAPDGVVSPWRYLAACVALLVVIHEAHELAHTATGRVLCGAWGPRDFNTWALPEGCATWLPTLAGPILSFAVMWAGWLVLRNRPTGWPLGVGLVLMANPLGRWFTAAMGGGDEGVLVREWFGLPRGVLATILAFGLVAALSSMPLAAAWRSLEVRRRLPAYLGMILLPMLVTGLLLFVLGNQLLRRGLLAQPLIAGTPLLVWLVTLAAVAALIAFRGALLSTRHPTHRPCADAVCPG
jgi:hypothetical protein